MPRLRRHFTYANVMSTIAVFAVLSGGVAYAAGLTRNSVRTKHIKASAVTAVKLRSSAVMATKIRTGAVASRAILDGSVTGTDVNESTLGEVPLAARETSHLHATKRVAASAFGATEAAGLENATAVPLFTSGPFTVYGKCFTTASGVVGEILISTTEAGTILESDGSYLYGQSGQFLAPTTPEIDRDVVNTGTGSNDSGRQSGDIPTFALAPSGAAILMHNIVAAKSGTLTGGSQGAYGDGNICVFNVEAQATSAA